MGTLVHLQHILRFRIILCVVGEEYDILWYRVINCHVVPNFGVGWSVFVNVDLSFNFQLLYVILCVCVQM